MRRLIATLVITAAAFSSPLLADDAPQDQKQQQEQPKKVEPVDFRKLKEFLPAAVGGVNREDAKGSKNTFGDAKISQAEGTYSAEGNEASAQITIVDYGGIPGMAEGMAIWTKTEIDNESDDEYQKTVTYSNFKGLESYNLKEMHGTLQLIVGNRIIVNIQLKHLDPTEFAKTVEAMKLGELEKLLK